VNGRDRLIAPARFLDDKGCCRLSNRRRPLGGFGGGANAIVPIKDGQLQASGVPEIVVRAGANAVFAAEEFFEATVNNAHTKRAYGRAVARFLAWCEQKGVELREITPGLAGEYVGQLSGSAPAKNQALAGRRHFFDGLVTRHAVALNPFASVRGVKHSAAEGATPEISIEQARKLLRSVDGAHVVGLRDRAVLGVLAYTCARVGAVAKLRLGDFRNLGEERSLRFREKGGKVREIS
jgi:integrase/recombinase XerD